MEQEGSQTSAVSSQFDNRPFCFQTPNACNTFFSQTPNTHQVATPNFFAPASSEYSFGPHNANQQSTNLEWQQPNPKPFSSQNLFFAQQQYQQQQQQQQQQQAPYQMPDAHLLPTAMRVNTVHAPEQPHTEVSQVERDLSEMTILQKHIKNIVSQRSDEARRKNRQAVFMQRRMQYMSSACNSQEVTAPGDETRQFNDIWSQNQELICQMTAMRMQNMTEEDLYQSPEYIEHLIQESLRDLCDQMYYEQKQKYDEWVYMQDKLAESHYYEELSQQFDQLQPE